SHRALSEHKTLSISWSHYPPKVPPTAMSCVMVSASIFLEIQYIKVKNELYHNNHSGVNY
ncbi:hypothetical protein, partial [Escherichia coli]|uniref:hypothetical protein n=1 Tax=Escherichia coli TaxID=562 RepID=UPI001BC89AED